MSKAAKIAVELAAGAVVGVVLSWALFSNYVATQRIEDLQKCRRQFDEAVQAFVDGQGIGYIFAEKPLKVLGGAIDRRSACERRALS